MKAMKLAIIATFAAANIAAGAFAGKTWEDRHRRPIEIRDKCAFYDMETGVFTHGKMPQTLDLLPMSEEPAERAMPVPAGTSTPSHPIKVPPTKPPQGH